jgi:NAD(P)-dependent dehydrogenase (short-subunit alcohol dehydrogenase family)
VRRFSEGFAAEHTQLDLLIANAGVMVPPSARRRRASSCSSGPTTSGTSRSRLSLLPLLRRTPGARVVVVSSGVHHGGRIDFDDLNWERKGYSAWRAYAQSKLANLLFALELQRRLAAAGDALVVTAAHPGYTATDLQRTAGVARLMNPLFGMRRRRARCRRCAPRPTRARAPATTSGRGASSR